MTDAHDGQEEPRRAPPPSARETAPVQPETAGPDSGRRRRGGGKRRGRRRDKPGSSRQPKGGKPTPVRDVTATTPPPAVDPDIEEADVEADGKSWTVRVTGRSGASSGSPAPLLLLGFWASGSSEGPPEREVMTVGRLLADLTPAQLESALERSREPPEPDRPRRFFSRENERRRS